MNFFKFFFYKLMNSIIKIEKFIYILFYVYIYITKKFTINLIFTKNNKFTSTYKFLCKINCKVFYNVLFFI